MLSLLEIFNLLTISIIFLYNNYENEKLIFTNKLTFQYLLLASSAIITIINFYYFYKSKKYVTIIQKYEKTVELKSRKLIFILYSWGSFLLLHMSIFWYILMK